MIKTPLSTVIGGAFWTPNCTILGGTSKTLNQIIKSLFANNEQGFYYDPNDLTTLYQDAAGTVPVTGVGQAVGLVLDKSNGLVLGSERIVNGNFNSGTTSWINIGTGGTFKVVSGQANITGGTNAGMRQSPFQIGKSYVISMYTKRAAGTANAVIWAGGSYYSSLFNSSGETISFIVANASWVSLDLGISGDGSTTTLIYDNISVKELSGNHAYQSTSSMRPLLVASPQRLDYDIADDKLITTLPAQLTGCTVVRAVPNVGTQILTNQTIPAPYNDNTDHCGLIVINRALTATETSQITQLFNKAAGV